MELSSDGTKPIPQSPEARLARNEFIHKVLPPLVQALQEPIDPSEVEPEVKKYELFFGKLFPVGEMASGKIKVSPDNLEKLRAILAQEFSTFEYVIPRQVANSDVYPRDFLSPRESLVLIKRFGLAKNPVQTRIEVGKDLSVSKEAVRVIEEKGMKKLSVQQQLGKFNSAFGLS